MNPRQFIRNQSFAITVLFLFAFLMTGARTARAGVEFQSPPEQTLLVELYTSEGCSSCPPAESFLSNLKSSGELWTNIVPVAFHVDYWDELGWKDRFSSASFTERQREYARDLRMKSVYTPNFIVGGKEWRGLSKGADLPPATGQQVGKLSLEINEEAAVTFETPGKYTNLTAHLAVLGIGVRSDIKAGENRGREMTHDFVVLKHDSFPLIKDGDTFSGRASFELPEEDAGTQYAVAAWVSKSDENRPVQAVGGYLPENMREGKGVQFGLFGREAKKEKEKIPAKEMKVEQEIPEKPVTAEPAVIREPEEETLPEPVEAIEQNRKAEDEGIGQESVMEESELLEPDIYTKQDAFGEIEIKPEAEMFQEQAVSEEEKIFQDQEMKTEEGMFQGEEELTTEAGENLASGTPAEPEIFQEESLTTGEETIPGYETMTGYEDQWDRDDLSEQEEIPEPIPER